MGKKISKCLIVLLCQAIVLGILPMNILAATRIIIHDENGTLYNLTMDFEGDNLTAVANGLPARVEEGVHGVGNSTNSPLPMDKPDGLYRMTNSNSESSRSYGIVAGSDSDAAFNVNLNNSSNVYDAYHVWVKYPLNRESTYETTADVYLENATGYTSARLDPIRLLFMSSSGNISSSTGREGKVSLVGTDITSSRAILAYTRVNPAGTATQKAYPDNNYEDPTDVTVVANGVGIDLGKWYRFKSTVNFATMTYESWAIPLPEGLEEGDAGRSKWIKVAPEGTSLNISSLNDPNLTAYFSILCTGTGSGTRTIGARYDNINIKDISSTAPPADKGGLVLTIDKVEDAIAFGNADGGYTDDSYAEFLEVVVNGGEYDDAKLILEKEDATQEEVDLEITKLEGYLNMLRESIRPTIKIEDIDLTQYTLPIDQSLGVVLSVVINDYHDNQIFGKINVMDGNGNQVENDKYKVLVVNGEEPAQVADDDKFAVDITEDGNYQVKLQFMQEGTYYYNAQLFNSYEKQLLATTESRPITVTGDEELLYHSLGFGAAITLSPTDRAGIDPNDVYVPVEGGVSRLWGVSGIGGGLLLPNGGTLTGPAIIRNSSKFMNKLNGTTHVELNEAAYVFASSLGAVHNVYGIRTAGGGKVEYIPNPGLLSGVVTKVTLNSAAQGGTGTVSATIKHNGTETVVSEAIKPPEGGVPPNGTFSLINIGEYENLESVVLSCDASALYPSITFEVVNENPGTPNPEPYYRTYSEPVYGPMPTPDASDVLPTPTMVSPLRINEVYSSGSPDWIEIYNDSDEDVDISNYGLTDNVTRPYKGEVPEGVSVPAKGFTVIYASNSTGIDGDGKAHVNFAISGSGEPIMLSGSRLIEMDDADKIIDVLDVPALANGTSICRVPDGSDILKITTEPTEGTSNVLSGGSEITLTDPVFSRDSGFYDEDFDLEIQSLTGKVYYTLDGSDPTIESRSWADINTNIEFYGSDGTTVAALPDIVRYEYETPINITNVSDQPNLYSNIKYQINGDFALTGNHTPNSYVPTTEMDKAMVVRAVAIDDDGNKSNIVTKTYFVDYDMREDFNQEAVISLVVDPEDLFKAGSGSTIEDRGGLIIRSDKIAEGRAYEYPTHMALFEGDGSKVIDQGIGMRLRGFGSKVHDQKTFTFYARSEFGGTNTFAYPLFPDAYDRNGDLIAEYRNFCVRTGSQRRTNARYMDGATQYLAKDLDQDYQESRLCTVFLNGEYWGSYYMQERVHEAYVENHTGIPRDYVDIVKNHELSDDTPEAAAAYEEYQKFNNWLSTADFSSDVLYDANGNPDENGKTNYDWLMERFDVEHAMLYLAATMSMENIDWGAFNLVQWKSRLIDPSNRFADGRWRFLLYDQDGAYRSHSHEGFYDLLQNFSLSTAFRSNEELKELFINTVCDVLNNQFDEARVFGELTYWQDGFTRSGDSLEMITDLVNRYKDGETKYTETGFTNAVGGETAGRIIAKEAGLIQYMADPSLMPSTRPDVLGITDYDYANLNVRVSNPQEGRVKINVMNHDFTRGSFTSRYYNCYKQTLEAIPLPGHVFDKWEITEGVTVTGQVTDTKIKVQLPEQGAVIKALFKSVPATEIYTVAQLNDLAAKVNGGLAQEGERYVLVDDIVFDGQENNFTPIGTLANPFTGTFDGQGYKVSGINTSLALQGQGLFGYVGTNGVVKRVAVVDSSFTGLDDPINGIEGKNIGAIAGNNAGIISDCYSIDSTITGLSTVGGIVGNNNGGTVKNCYSTNTVQLTGESTASSIGGVAGKSEGGAIINCFSITKPVGTLEKGGKVVSLDGTEDVEGAEPVVNIPTPEADFGNGTVVRLLNENNTTEIWFQGDGHPTFGAHANMTYDPETNKITIQSDGEITAKKLYVASFTNEGRLEWVEIFDVDFVDGIAEVTLEGIAQPNNNQSQAKFYAWMDDFSPMVRSISGSIDLQIPPIQD